MSGLCAIFSDASDTGSTIDAMLARMVHYPWLHPVRHASPGSRAALGAVAIDGRAAGSVVSSRDQRFTAAIDGEFLDAASERRRLEALGARFESGSHAELLVEGWRHEGTAFLARQHGEFAAALWDDTSRQLHVITDRFGLRPLYVAQSAGRFVAASEIKALLEAGGVNGAWSREGVSQFFAFGHFYNDNTLLEGVRAVGAATCGTYSEATGRYEEQIYWRLSPGTDKRPQSDLGAALEDSFVRAVARRAQPGERLGLSLSGGLDARTILGVMPDGADLQTVSLGMEGSLDHRSAGRLAALAGVPHHPYLLDANFLATFEQHLRRMVYLTDGHYLDQGIVMPTMSIYRKLGIEYLMRGHGGELLHMTKAYAFSLDAAALRASDAALDEWLFSHLTGYMLGGVPADLFTFDVREAAHASLRRALNRCVAADQPVDRVWQLFLNERLHRETTLSMHTFGCFATIRQPYLDNDVIDVLFSMPARMKLGDELQTSLLRHRRPDFLAVTNSNTGARLGAGRIENGLARLRLKVGAKLGWKGYQPYERLGLWLRRELRDVVERALGDEAFLDQDVIRPDVVKRIVAQHNSQQANHTFLIMSLLIFALGRRARAEPDQFAA